MIDQALIAQLKTVQAVIDAGIASANKVYWLRFADPKLAPALTFAMTGGQPGDLTACGDIDPETTEFDLYAWSRNGCEAATLIEGIKDALHGAAWTADGTEVMLCEVTSRLEDHWEPEPFSMAGRGISLRLTSRASA